jgi:hypothetical protein
VDDDGQSERVDGELESDIDDELESDAMEVDTFLAYVYEREKGEADEQFRIGRIHAVKKELVTVHYCWSAFRRGTKLQTAKWKLWQRNRKKRAHLVTFNKEHIITLLPDMRYHEKTKSYYLGSADRKCLATKLEELDRVTEAVRNKRRRTGSNSSNRRTGRIDDDDDDGDDDGDDDDDYDDDDEERGGY